MRDLFKFFLMLCCIVLVYVFRSNISNFILNDIIYGRNNEVLTYNEYYLDYDYSYVQNTDTKSVKSKNDILNMIYTILNSGDDNFSFYCDYDNCLDDIKTLVNDKDDISHINNFVHPFNSYATINVDITNSGKITIKTKKVYDDDQIKYVENYIRNFIDRNINDTMTTEDKIKAFHDYIIDNTIYDKDRTMDTYTAYNLITTSKSICGGYSDIMAIYLDMLNIQNYKIVSENHVWNLVNVDGKWLHLDLTWDDPVASDGNQYLLHNFFLIDTEELLKLDTVEHTFDKNVYKEAN